MVCLNLPLSVEGAECILIFTYVGSWISPSPTIPSSATSRTLVSASSAPENKLELLLSLDVALEVIHADREALKRVETFAGYPGHYGHRVRDTIEELFILMLGALGDEHLRKGFAKYGRQLDLVRTWYLC